MSSTPISLVGSADAPHPNEVAARLWFDLIRQHVRRGWEPPARMRQRLGITATDISAWRAGR